MVFGATRMLRWRQTTSSRISAGDSCWSSARVTASIVPGAISCPSAIRSDSSRTTVSPAATASASPSSVTTFPRRKTSESRCSSSALRIASCEPARPAATSLASSICLRAKGFPDLCGHSLAVGAAADLRHHQRHDLAHLLRHDRAGLGHRLGDDRVQLVVGDLGREIAGDQLGLALLLVGQVGAPALAVLLGGVEAALAFAAQHGDLVLLALLGRELQ